MTEEAVRPIFVMGTQRSGTSLLRLMLDSHENISIGFETGFMRGADLIKNIPDWSYGKGWYRRYGLDEAAMNDRIGRFYSEIFAQHAAAQGKRRWGEKTPMNLHYMAEMTRMFPDAQFICIVRHAGAVGTSLTRWSYTFEEAVDYWVKGNRRFRRLGPQLGSDRFHLCRYEDLVSEPRRVLGEVMAFLGEPWSESVLRHHEVQAAQGPARVEGGTRADRAVDQDSVDAWTAQLDEARLGVLRTKAKGLLRYFGYRIRTAVPAGAARIAQT